MAYWLRGAVSPAPTYTDSEVTFATSSPPPDSFTGDRAAFIGRNRSLRDPAAMEHARLPGGAGAGLDPCAAVQITVEIEPGQDAEARFDAAFTFQYSPRPGTAAGTFDHQVPKEVVQERFDRLVALQEGISLERNAALVGTTVEVLIEGEGRKANLKGRTRTNKLVHVPGLLPAGAFAEATITQAHPHHLAGSVVSADVPA